MAHPSHGAHHAPPQSKSELAKVMLAALGVVFGDIGTSPLYTLKECFRFVRVSQENVFGVLSLAFWSLTLLVTVKYLTFVMRADNHGEGGILSLLALLRGSPLATRRRTMKVFTVMALIGGALLYGDGMITPALSVLSAVEGLKIATESLEPVVLPLTIVVLVVLFAGQRFGTAKVGALFGPLMLIWFGTLIATGLPHVLHHPEILRALDPRFAVRFFLDHGLMAFLLLGSVVLCVTGGEALYADMGHFGAGPIRMAWYGLVYPALVINYFGQGANLLAHPEAVVNPFYSLVDGWVLYPLIGVATLSAVVASQALISGAFSLTQQAVQLGLFPRVSIVHTSGEAEGQVYVPEINTLLMVACICLVLGFGSSEEMAAAYGIAVTGTMVVTSVLFGAVAKTRWGWPSWLIALLTCAFLLLDLAFFSANLVKVRDGGWFPLAVGAAMLTIMLTWQRGRALVYANLQAAFSPLEQFLSEIERLKPPRVPGSAVFMTSNPDGAPPILRHHFRHNKVLHEQVLLLSIVTSHQPEVPRDERLVSFRGVGHGFYQVTASYGFMQTPNAIEVLQVLRRVGLMTTREDTSFYLGRETLVPARKSPLSPWRRSLFMFLLRNARPATAFFRIPANRVVELGVQIEL